MSYLRVVCLGKEISLADCSGAVVQDPGHNSCRHGDLHVCLIYSFLPGCRGSGNGFELDLIHGN